MSISSFNFDTINSTVANVVQQVESDLKTKIQNTKAEAGTAEFLELQREVSKWSIMTSVQSTLVKELGDAIKGVIQKTG